MGDEPAGAWRPGMGENELSAWIVAVHRVMTDSWERGDADVWGTMMTEDVVVSSQRSMTLGESGSWEDLLPSHRAAIDVFPHCRLSDVSFRIVSPTVSVVRQVLTTSDDLGNEMAMWVIARVDRGLISRIVILDDDVADSALAAEMDLLASA